MIEPNWSPDSRQLRQFAIASLFGFGVVGVVLWRIWGSPRAALLAWTFGAAVCVLGLFRPTSLRLLHVLLLAITLPIGWAISSILLRVLFYGVLTPLGWALRLTGRDPLSLKRPQAATHWKEYRSPDDVTSYYRQS